jgi:hypothetical protein
MSMVLTAALVRPRRVVKVGEDLCFDDWCIGVADVRSSGVSYDVNIRVSSRARGRVQRANGASVYMTDGQGRRFDPLLDARDLGIVLTHGEGVTPDWFVIGEGPPPFYKPAIVRLGT